MLVAAVHSEDDTQTHTLARARAQRTHKSQGNYYAFVFLAGVAF